MFKVLKISRYFHTNTIIILLNVIHSYNVENVYQTSGLASTVIPSYWQLKSSLLFDRLFGRPIESQPFQSGILSRTLQSIFITRQTLTF